MIIFLDFDGVLHPQFEGQMVPREIAFCHVPRFEAIMRDFPAVKIVISSTWRIHFDLTHLREWFSEDIAGRIIGATPLLKIAPLMEKREAEILAWLSAHGQQSAPWLALDDAYWQFKLHRNRVVVCQSHKGLDEAVAHNLRAALTAGI